ncbi:MAG: hypothetical protein P8X65_15075 [Syntrophobacterales bacterium]
MIKILLERRIKGRHVAEIVQLLRQLRVLAMQQLGYIGGETLHDVESQLLSGDQHLVIFEGLAGLVQ